MTHAFFVLANLIVLVHAIVLVISATFDEREIRPRDLLLYAILCIFIVGTLSVGLEESETKNCILRQQLKAMHNGYSVTEQTAREMCANKAKVEP